MVKEIRLRPKSDPDLFRAKVRRAESFLLRQATVQIVVLLRGRETTHAEDGRELIDQFVQTLQSVGELTNGPTKIGRRMICTLQPS